jgi:hypothetical protein
MLPRSATKTLQSATASHRICEMLLPCSMGLSHRSSPMTLRLLSMYRSWHPHPFVFHGSERKPLTTSVFEPRPTRNQTLESMRLVNPTLKKPALDIAYSVSSMKGLERHIFTAIRSSLSHRRTGFQSSDDRMTPQWEPQMKYRLCLMR